MKYDAERFANAGLLVEDRPDCLMVWFDSGKTGVRVGKREDGELDLHPSRSSDHRRLMAALNPEQTAEIQSMGYQPKAYGA